MGTEPESVDVQKGTMKDVFARCLNKNKAQVCTLLKTCALSERGISTFIASTAGKPTSEIYIVLHY
jgi:hypothetical protein